MRLHLSLSSRSARDGQSPASKPLFAAPELVDVRHPSSQERAALAAVGEHPPHVASVSADAAQALAAREQTPAVSPDARADPRSA